MTFIGLLLLLGLREVVVVVASRGGSEREMFAAALSVVSSALQVA